MKSKTKLFIILFIFALSIPTNSANALPKTSLPPADLFQLPWEQDIAWVSLDAFDNGFKRGPKSPHLYINGGAVDFAPRRYMVEGEDTSNFWVNAAAAGTVVVKSSCHLVISHPGGWVTEYQFLAKIQVGVGDAVYRNQHLGIIANGTSDQRFCPPVEHDIPHVHFSLRPDMEMAAFAGWEVNYNPLFNKTTFIKNGETAYQYDPLLNIPALQIDRRGDITWDTTYIGSLDKYRYEKWHFLLSDTVSFSLTASPSTVGLKPLIILLDVSGNELVRGTEILTSTQVAGDYFVQIQPQEGQGFYNLILERMENDKAISVVGAENVKVGEKTTVNVYFNQVPPNEYASTEITCSYDANLLEVGNMVSKDIFGTDPAVAINDPQNGTFIYAIAGSHGQKATENGAVFSFEVTGLKEGQSTVVCSGNISLGDGTLTDIGSDSLVLNILEGTPIPEPTPNPEPNAAQINGQIFASKPVTISLYDTENLFVKSASVQADNSFTLNVPVGTYTINAEAGGFIDARGSVTLVAEQTHTMQNITLLAGDIDNNNVINQLDAMSIAMNYNTASPEVADLNGDGIINLLDLEILAQNYRFSGVLNWEGSTTTTIWQPPLGSSFSWQFGNPIDSSYDVDIYDLDAFDTSATLVSDLHAQGRKVICYISVGSWEEWRPDAGDFPASLIGNDYEGWAGEKWLDIRQIDMLAPIMRARLDICAQKGFDGIEPDNMALHWENTGFPISYADQLAYNIWLSNEAHVRGLSIGLKNDEDQVGDLLPYFDWALTEDCFHGGWCNDVHPFVQAGKPVFSAEYTDKMSSTEFLNNTCSQAENLGFYVFLKNRNLDVYREDCL